VSPARGLRAERPAPLDPAEVDPLLLAAIDEDLGAGDLTSELLVPPERWARGRLVCKGVGVLAGLDVFVRVFELLDPAVRVERLAADGERVGPGMELAVLVGRARALLAGERTALNLVQRMSGIATATATCVERAGGRARVLDTRKTTPGLRALEKYAVRCGGGENHRMGLYDEVMIKNNHVDLAGAGLSELLLEVRRVHGERVRVTAEARNEREALDAAAGGADVVLLDNMDVETMGVLCPRLRAAAERAGRTIEIEASGGVDLESVGRIAASGVDRISIGALTHSAAALDLSFALSRTQ
jgi:nicotinate-nucleotide pyrophosphorylase (carboxylating)